LAKNQITSSILQAANLSKAIFNSFVGLAICGVCENIECPLQHGSGQLHACNQLRKQLFIEYSPELGSTGQQELKYVKKIPRQPGFQYLVQCTPENKYLFVLSVQLLCFSPRKRTGYFISRE